VSLPRLDLNSIYVDAAALGTGVAAELLTAEVVKLDEAGGSDFQAAGSS
jgi:hypothetical protein